MRDSDTMRRWIADLRSGTFHQGVGELKVGASRDDGQALYCCLGVLCDRNGDLEAGTHSRGPWHTEVGYHTATLPVELREKYRLSEDEADVFMQLNDQLRTPFRAIANIIEDSLDRWDGDLKRAVLEAGLELTF